MNSLLFLPGLGPGEQALLGNLPQTAAVIGEYFPPVCAIIAVFC